MSELTNEKAIVFEEKMVRYWKNKKSKYKRQTNKDICEENIQRGLKEIAKLKSKQSESMKSEN